MSSVRMSEKLRIRIKQKGDQIFAVSSNRLNGNLAKDFHDRAATEYINTEMSFSAEIPDKWTAKIDNVTYTINYLVNGTLLTEMAFSQRSLIKKITIPKIYGLYSENFGDSKILDIPKGFKFSQGLCDEISKWRQAIRLAHDEQHAFTSELKRILTRCNTLKQFLDTWPQGENLVPPEVLAKLNEKPVREKKEPLMTEEASVALSTTLLKRTLMS